MLFYQSLKGLFAPTAAAAAGASVAHVRALLGRPGAQAAALVRFCTVIARADGQPSQVFRRSAARLPPPNNDTRPPPPPGPAPEPEAAAL